MQVGEGQQVQIVQAQPQGQAQQAQSSTGQTMQVMQQIITNTGEIQQIPVRPVLPCSRKALCSCGGGSASRSYTQRISYTHMCRCTRVFLNLCPCSPRPQLASLYTACFPLIHFRFATVGQRLSTSPHSTYAEDAGNHCSMPGPDGPGRQSCLLISRE